MYNRLNMLVVRTKLPRRNPSERVKPVPGVAEIVEDGEAGVDVERASEPEYLAHGQPGVADASLLGPGQRVTGGLLADQRAQNHHVIVAVLRQVGSRVGRQVDEVLRGKQVLQEEEKRLF